MTEITLATFGLRGKRVRVYRCATASGTKLVRVEWRERGKRVRESWPDTRENVKLARAYGEGVAERLAQRATVVRERLTLATLVQRYRLANDHWRPATVTATFGRLRQFLLFAGETLYADLVTPELLDEYRAVLRARISSKTKKTTAPNQIANAASEVKALFRFARMRKLIAENPLAEYTVRLAKDEKRDETSEYSNEEWGAVLQQLDPKLSHQWRPYCLMLLAGVLGPRQNALRHLTWEDVDLRAQEVTWRGETDKMGKERTQPLPRDAVRAFRIARVWRRRAKYSGPWIFFGAQERTRGKKPYGYQALNKQLHEAETRAGVAHIPYRALHGFRRTSAGNVHALTGGNIKDAGDWIGDTDLKSLMKYLKKRDPRQREVAGLVSAPATEQPTAAQPPRAPNAKS